MESPTDAPISNICTVLFCACACALLNHSAKQKRSTEQNSQVKTAVGAAAAQNLGQMSSLETAAHSITRDLGPPPGL